MINEFRLEKILPNPYQTRDGEDPEHIRNLALSIGEHGLLQVPSARIAQGQQGENAQKDPLVQLVFGHSRLAAFKYLRDSGITGFSTMPLNIVEMSDEEMFQAAVAENRDRKDLTPIEEAKAMLVYRDQFKKTSDDIGKLFHLSDSAVRNKLRLLDLPVEIQERVGKTLSEGAAREVLAFQSLPEEIKLKTSWHDGDQHTYEAIMQELVVAGVETGELKEVVDDAVKSGGVRMDRKLWRNTDELAGEGVVGLCRGCQFITTRNGTDYCLKESCFDAKEKAYRMNYLSQASLLSGIAVLEDGKEGYGAHTDFSYGKENLLETSRAKKCENLRIMFEMVSDYNKRSHLVAEGFEHAKIVCGKRSGQCTCMKAHDAGFDVEGGTEEDLKAMRRQMLQAQRNELDLIKHMKADAGNRLSDELEAGSFEAWRLVLEKLTYHSGFKEAETMYALIVRLVELVIEKCTWGGRKDVLNQLNGLLKNCGLEELNISFGEEGERPDNTGEGECVGEFVEPPHQGKTLMEVFEQEGGVE